MSLERRVKFRMRRQIIYKATIKTQEIMIAECLREDRKRTVSSPAYTYLLVRVEGVRVNAVDEGGLGEGVQAVAVRVQTDLSVVREVLLQGELAGDAARNIPIKNISWRKTLTKGTSFKYLLK